MTERRAARTPSAPLTLADRQCAPRRKHELLHPSALHLDWRPLHRIIKTVYFAKLRAVVHVRADRHGPAIQRLVRSARRHFGPDAADELLQAFRPLLCPVDQMMYMATGFLCLFLPTCTYGPDGGYWWTSDRWLVEMMSLWDCTENMCEWDLQFLRLYSRLARDALGRVDWTPFVPRLFSKFLQLLYLPVGSAQLPARTQSRLPSSCSVFLGGDDLQKGCMMAMASMIVYSMTPGAECVVQKHLALLLQMIESFYHPSNAGSWSARLAQFMGALCGAFVGRLKLERRAALGLPTATAPPPASSHLGVEDRRRFAAMMRPLIMTALFSKSSLMSWESIRAANCLAYIAPEEILPPLLQDRIYPALETVTEAHQVAAAIYCLAAVTRPLVWHRRYAAGAQHLMPLLHMTLPGIDVNDTLKSEATAFFLSCVAICVPLQDTSSVADTISSEELSQVCLSTAAFEGWLVQVMHRIFALCENLLEPPKGTRASRSTDSVAFTQVVSLLGARILTNASEALFDVALDSLYRYATTSLRLNAVKSIGHLCAAACAANPPRTTARFVPFLCDRILEIMPPPAAPMSSPADAGVADDDAAASVTDDEVVWCLSLLGYVVPFAGDSLLDYRARLCQVLDATLGAGSRKIHKLASKLFGRMLLSLTRIRENELGPMDRALRSDARATFDAWGEPVQLEQAALSWRVPTDEQQLMVDSLLERYVDPVLQRLRSSVPPTASDPASATGHAVATQPYTTAWLRGLCLLSKALRALASACPVPGGEPDDPSDRPADEPATEEPEREEGDGVRSRVRLRKHRYLVLLSSSIEGTAYTYRSTHWWNSVGEFLHFAAQCTLQHMEDDTKAMRTLVKCTEIFLTRTMAKIKSTSELRAHYRHFKSFMRDPLAVEKQPLRSLLLLRVRFLTQLRRGKNKRTNAIDPVRDALLHDLLTLCMNGYARVRIIAQSALHSAVRTYWPSRYRLWHRLVAALHPDARLSADSVKGALYTLSLSPFVTLAVTRWRNLRSLATALCRCSHVERPSVQNLVWQLFTTIETNLYTVNVFTELPESLAASADQLRAVAIPLPMAHLQRLYPEPIADAAVVAGRGKLRETGERALLQVTQLRNELLDLLSEPTGSMHWRYEFMASTFLLHLIRPDLPLHVPLVEWFLRSLISDSVVLRDVGITALNAVLNIARRPSPAVRLSQCTSITCNRYAAQSMPRTAEAWHAAIFVDRNAYGYGDVWPIDGKGYCYAPDSDAYRRSQPPAELGPVDALLLARFSDAAYLTRLLALMDAEQSKQARGATGRATHSVALIALALATGGPGRRMRTLTTGTRKFSRGSSATTSYRPCGPSGRISKSSARSARTVVSASRRRCAPASCAVPSTGRLPCKRPPGKSSARCCIAS